MKDKREGGNPYGEMVRGEGGGGSISLMYIIVYRGTITTHIKRNI